MANGYQSASVINFASSSAAGGGNSNITIDHDSMQVTPVVAAVIYSQGASNALNQNNTITNNSIANFQGTSGVRGYGIEMICYR